MPEQVPSVSELPSLLVSYEVGSKLVAQATPGLQLSPERQAALDSARQAHAQLYQRTIENTEESAVYGA